MRVDGGQGYHGASDGGISRGVRVDGGQGGQMEVRDITGRESRWRSGISQGVRVDGGQGYHGA